MKAFREFAGTTDVQTPEEQSRDWVPRYPVGYVPRPQPAICLTHTPRERAGRGTGYTLPVRDAARARAKSAPPRRQRGRT